MDPDTKVASHRALGAATCLLLAGHFLLAVLLIPKGVPISGSVGDRVLPALAGGLLAGLVAIPTGVGILLRRPWGYRMALGLALLEGLCTAAWTLFVFVTLLGHRESPDDLWLVPAYNGACLAYFGGHAAWTLASLWGVPTTAGTHGAGLLRRLLPVADGLASVAYVLAGGYALLLAVLSPLLYWIGPLGPSSHARQMGLGEAVLISVGSLLVGVVLCGLAWLHFRAMLPSDAESAARRRRRLGKICAGAGGLSLAGVALLLADSALGMTALGRSDALFGAVLVGLAGVFYAGYLGMTYGVLRAAERS